MKLIDPLPVVDAIVEILFCTVIGVLLLLRLGKLWAECKIPPKIIRFHWSYAKYRLSVITLTTLPIAFEWWGITKLLASIVK